MNNDYVAERVKVYPDRLIQFADVDCSWTETYHTPGVAGRLAVCGRSPERSAQSAPARRALERVQPL